jgi:hypothetical protein
MSIQRITNLIALILLLAFLAPYIYKLSQIDITLVLLGGAGLVIYDFFSAKDD